MCEFEGVGRIPDANHPSIGTGHEWLIYCRDHTRSAVIQFRLTQPKPSLAYGVNRNLSTVIGSTEQSRYRVDRRCDWRNPAAGSGIRAVKRPPPDRPAKAHLRRSRPYPLPWPMIQRHRQSPRRILREAAIRHPSRQPRWPVAKARRSTEAGTFACRSACSSGSNARTSDVPVTPQHG